MPEIIYLLSIIFELKPNHSFSFLDIWKYYADITQISIVKTFIGNGRVYYENATKLIPSSAYCNFSKNADWIE